MFDRNSFTVEEWAEIVAAPAAVGALVVTADPSGPVGLIGEFRAVMTSMKEYIEANAASSPLMAALQEHMTTKPSEEEEAQLKQWASEQQEIMKANKPKNPEELKQMVRDKTSAALTLLRGKGASEADINSFKTMTYAIAEAVANASKEGGFLGFGGTLVSEAEQSILTQIKSELGV